uniref:Protein kinase domain-containing protein n=1 Tax=Rhizophagus irregularis (strain DAOM 181602 / DAOM 197198 / MUCL 43194) TaxID=747089 RepID=U9TWS6_RHIID
MNELFKWIDEAIAKKHIKHYEYKYFKNIQEIGIGTIKELVHELLSIITLLAFMKFTISDQEIKVTALRNYLLVMEYADGAVSCLHDEDIIHRDLHSYNVLVNQDTIKLAILDCQKELKH